MSKIELSIEGLSCAGCVRRAEEAIAGVEGASEVSVNLATRRASLDLGDAGLEDVTQALTKAGYPARVESAVFVVEGMSCASCVGRLNKALSGVSGVPDALTITMPAVPTDVATADALGSGFDSYARCRLSNVALNNTDAAGVFPDAVNGISDGEVEDYPVDFVPENVFDLALQKTTTQVGSVKPGATVTFDVKVINQGTVAAEDIIITDYIPAGLTLVDNAGGDGTGSGTFFCRSICTQIHCHLCQTSSSRQRIICRYR